jgi:hypothetical protein
MHRAASMFAHDHVGRSKTSFTIRANTGMNLRRSINRRISHRSQESHGELRNFPRSSTLEKFSKAIALPVESFPSETAGPVDAILDFPSEGCIGTQSGLLDLVFRTCKSSTPYHGVEL